MNTTFRTVCTEEVMHLTFPGELLFPCTGCQQRVCLAADGDRCPRCQQIALDARRRAAHIAVAPNADAANASAESRCSCPACRAAATQEGRDRIADWNGYVDAQNARTGAAGNPRDLYALQLVGDALKPRFRSGDWLIIDPSPVAIEAVQPGDAVLAQVRLKGRCEPHMGVYFLNGDSDLFTGKGDHHAAGTFRIVGVVIGK